MAKKAKKAFTIVELVIVIAVVAILMAVLIPTFVSLVKKANISSDSQLVRNLNTILTAEGVTEGKNPTMHDALADAFENGYDITKISPTSEGNDIVWDSKNDRFALVHINEDRTMETIYSDSATPLSTGVDLWKIYDKMPDTQTYSIYAGKNWTNTEVGTAGTPLTVGFDAGDVSTITSVLYQRGARDAGQTVAIRTNGGTLTVNAANDTVKHYGEANKVTVQAIKPDSYYEYGKLQVLYIASGHVVTDGNAYISCLFVNPSTGTVKVSLKIDSVGNLYYKEDGLEANSVIPDSIRKEVLTEGIASSESLKIVAGGKVYESISEAVQDGGEIDLIEDIEVSKSGTEPAFTIVDGSDLRLNGNAIAITSPSGQNGIKLDDKANATISNGIISQDKGYGSTYPIIGAKDGELTLTGMSIKLLTKEGVSVSAGSGKGRLIIKDSMIEGPNEEYVNNAVFCGSGAKVVIENSTIVGSIRIENNGFAELRSGDFTQTTFYCGGSGRCITISGGVFAIDPRTNTKMEVVDGYTVMQDGDKYLVVSLSELTPAMVKTAEELNTALQSDGFVKLAADIALDDGFIVTVPTGKRILLDLNGHKITENSKSVRNIEIEGSLIIQDTSAAGTGEIRNTFVGEDGQDGCYGLIKNSGTLIIHSGIFTNVAHGNGSSIRNTDTGKLTITGGTFISAVDDSGMSTEDNEEQDWTDDYGKGNRLIYSTGILTITGGTFTMTNTQNVSAICAANARIENAVITSTDSDAIWAENGNGVEIISGTINGDLNVDYYAMLSISGGTFTSDPTEYLAEGYAVIQNGDTWNVVKQ